MQLQEVLEKRRSIREYQNKPVEREKIQAIIQAATLAPSWKNSQTARYYIVSGPKTLQAVKSVLPEFNQKNVENAPVLIVTTFVTGRSGFGSGGDPDNELGNGWGCYDCGLQNDGAGTFHAGYGNPRQRKTEGYSSDSRPGSGDGSDRAGVQ